MIETLGLIGGVGLILAALIYAIREHGRTRRRRLRSKAEIDREMPR